jgi:hypothetical protein
MYWNALIIVRHGNNYMILGVLLGKGKSQTKIDETYYTPHYNLSAYFNFQAIILI